MDSAKRTPTVTRQADGGPQEGTVRLTVRPAEPLWGLLPPRRRRSRLDVPHDGESSLGHVVEALGIPLTEVGALLVDGVTTSPAHRPAPEEVIDVEPVARPQRWPAGAAGFLLDVHLGVLARRLRLLGVDVAYDREDLGDDALLEAANTQHRVLLTRDRRLLMRRALWAGAYVHGDRPDEQVVDVLERFDPPLAPWSRCVVCNGGLTRVPKEDVADLLEPGTRRCYQHFSRCRDCGRVYWRGAHARRLDDLVARSGAGRRPRSTRSAATGTVGPRREEHADRQEQSGQ